MIPGELNTEINVTKIETQNEIKSKEIKKSVDKSLTSVKIHEIHKQQDADEHKINVDSEIINVINMDTPASNVQEHSINAGVTNIYRMENRDTNFRKMFNGYLRNNKQRTHPKDYWVQFHVAGGIPDDSSPLAYDSSRNSFVAIVFLITLIMLLLTSFFVGFIYFSDDLRDYFMYQGKLLLFVGLGGMLIINYAMMCSACARMLPCNIIMLCLAVFFMSLIAAYITAFYSTDIILVALVVTAITVLVCLCLAFTSFDFTQFLLYVIVISVAFTALVLVVSIVSLTTGFRYKPLHLVLLTVGTLLNVIILIIQLQMILGGRAVEISEDDWALAAYMLYTSIVDIFLQLIQLIGALADDF